jgi:hypothetical protein
VAGWVNGTAAMAASPQHRAMSAVLSAPRGHPLRPTNAQLISVLWRFVREWRGDALESPAALEPPAAAMVGYDPHTPMDKLSKNMMPSYASAEAARVFLKAHWLKEGGERWRALGADACTRANSASCSDSDHFWVQVRRGWRARERTIGQYRIIFLLCQHF